ncbi:MAG: cysteine--tRNA ligase [Gammaproteobacteria bacterium]|nr:cysteine--tRNA ligase [Gammaproteobacteria bacterium]
MSFDHQLSVHNNLTNQKELFVPIDAQRVGLYVCGMTVYDYCHIGHARVLVVFDVIYRYLCQVYGHEHVHYVRNVTDIDDKIIARANENGESFETLTHRFIELMHEDSEQLGVIPPNEEPRATMHMAEIITMIERLVEKGFAYPADNGDVYYAVEKFENYGQLSGKDLDDLQAGERVAVDQSKRNPFDFVLWKAAKPEEPSWDSPWGKGRPGWHIECSAMSTHCLGDHFDIHGGGLDLQFPHHENEIAQSEAATGCKFVNYWMHNGFVRIDDEKMSKSLGNFFTIREVMEKYDPEVIRYFILTSHYRSPLNYSDTHLDNARAALTKLYTALNGIEPADVALSPENPRVERFFKVMDDDFNTPEALALLFEVAHEVNRMRDSDSVGASEAAGLLVRLGELLGLLQGEPLSFLQGEQDDAEQIEALIAARNRARANKDWAESDRVRDELQSMGVVLEDGAGGTTWRKA